MGSDAGCQRTQRQRSEQSAQVWPGLRPRKSIDPEVSVKTVAVLLVSPHRCLSLGPENPVIRAWVRNTLDLLTPVGQGALRFQSRCCWFGRRGYDVVAQVVVVVEPVPL